MTNQRRAVFLGSIMLNVVFVILVAFLSYRLTQLDQEPKLYSFDLATDDLHIKNVEIVVYPDSIYVGEQYLERNGDEKSFEGISYGLNLGGRMVTSVSQADDPFTLPDAAGGRFIMSTNNVFKRINISENDTINVLVIYKVDGKTKNYTGQFSLSEVKRPFSWVGSGTVVQLSDQGTVVTYANQSTVAASVANDVSGGATDYGLSITDGVAKWSEGEGGLTSIATSDEIFQQTIHEAVFPLLLPKLPFEATHRAVSKIAAPFDLYQIVYVNEQQGIQLVLGQSNSKVTSTPEGKKGPKLDNGARTWIQGNDGFSAIYWRHDGYTYSLLSNKVDGGKFVPLYDTDKLVEIANSLQ
ncbi:hypothetical protein M3201_12075 [Paenibacillus motobuensis]|uniref:hypothetical protein n=1 Tax=Paenibacillus TaxID=44249 RepID=UPI00203CA4F4|nr:MULTISPECIES: hypothetical protein [Paenibacillus]MCM3040432.1 hypothetical protein [Paenibacillus lutimineralis]MCM3647536.1 hypothetical protein [Paenibacillus motobuensis]